MENAKQKDHAVFAVFALLGNDTWKKVYQAGDREACENWVGHEADHEIERYIIVLILTSYSAANIPIDYFLDYGGVH